jgi:hypothetical protein
MKIKQILQKTKKLPILALMAGSIFFTAHKADAGLNEYLLEKSAKESKISLSLSPQYLYNTKNSESFLGVGSTLSLPVTKIKNTFFDKSSNWGILDSLNIDGEFTAKDGKKGTDAETYQFGLTCKYGSNYSFSLAAFKSDFFFLGQQSYKFTSLIYGNIFALQYAPKETSTSYSMLYLRKFRISKDSTLYCAPIVQLALKNPSSIPSFGLGIKIEYKLKPNFATLFAQGFYSERFNNMQNTSFDPTNFKIGLKFSN